MKTVGLLSGGKDSVYNLLHCVVQGHEPVALASLGPGEGKDEIDSYMYQTVGHSGLASIAEAFELPLFTHTISGTAVNLEGEYGSREGGAGGGKGREASGTAGDETEDLYELLRKVKLAMPEVEAVACGAILSNYQRVRVEHVCSRLGLMPIAYLWERNQEELLREMVGAGMESILVKVAGAGLGVEHLGKTLGQMEPTLLRLNQKYQLHVCGEGGEYETFTLDCPLFSKRVVLDQTTPVVSNDDPFSTVAHLHLDRCSLAPKPDHPVHETWEQKRDRIRQLLVIPEILDDDSAEILNETRGAYALEVLPVELQGLVVAEKVVTAARISRVGDWLGFSEVTAWGDESSTRSSLTPEKEVRACFRNLEALLAQHSATLLSLAHLTLYLSNTSMALFPSINVIYSTYFGSSPPTRACVAVLMPDSSGVRLKLEGVARLGDGVRKSLHVQSLSYWAAANIGPYSQGVTVGQRLFVAGQISLIPASLTLPSPTDFATEVALSLQHVRRVAIAAKERRWEGWCDGGICWIADVEGGEWDRRLAGARAGWEAFDGEAPMLYVSAATLPKGASVEWQVTYATGRTHLLDEDDEPVVARRISRMMSTVFLIGGLRVELSSKSDAAGEVLSIVAGCPEHEEVAINIAPGRIHLIKAFHLPHVSTSQILRSAAVVFGIKEDALPAVSFIAVNHVATWHSGAHALAFVAFGSSERA